MQWFNPATILGAAVGVAFVFFGVSVFIPACVLYNFVVNFTYYFRVGFFAVIEPLVEFSHKVMVKYNE